MEGGDAIAQWIHPRLPSCGFGFDSKAHDLHFFNLYLNSDQKLIKINKKEAKDGLFLKKFRWKY